MIFFESFEEYAGSIRGSTTFKDVWNYQKFKYEVEIEILKKEIDRLEAIMEDAAKKTHNSKMLFDWYTSDYSARK